MRTCEAPRKLDVAGRGLVRSGPRVYATGFEDEEDDGSDAPDGSADD